MSPKTLWLLWALLAPAVAAQQASIGSEGIKPKLGCPDLRSLTGYDFSIVSATVVPAAGDTPEHCRVSGQILPEVRFELSLPATWNRKLYMFGNGGFAGEPFDAPGRVALRNRALRQGFAVTSTDTGHDAASEPLATFAVNRQKLLDYAFRAIHTTAETAKRVSNDYYAVPVARSYFEGCSTGGRQGLILAQRFPRDFDSIVVGAPVLDFTGTMISYAWRGKALIEGPIPTAKLKVVAEKIYSECDGKDGLMDGLIDDPSRCSFAPARDLPKCEGDVDGPACFTSRQIAALERIYSDVSAGWKRLFPGYPVSAEIAGPSGRSGWDNWIVRDGGKTIAKNFLESFMRYMAFPEKNPSYDWRSFNIESDPARMEGIRKILDATDTDLSSFHSAGGKLVMYYGWADPALNALMGVEYYEKMAERMGASSREFFRLFMVPGMFHCTDGVGVSNFDWLSPVIDWVEKGKPPERIVGSLTVNGRVERTRPVCAYPQVARYRGSGSIDDAANFLCKEP